VGQALALGRRSFSPIRDRPEGKISVHPVFYKNNRESAVDQRLAQLQPVSLSIFWYIADGGLSKGVRFLYCIREKDLHINRDDKK
jgi:hypothetical protein